MLLDIDKIKVVIFDFDGVLADTGADIAGAIKATQEHFGLEPWDQKKILSFVGHGAKNLVDNTLAEAGEERLGEALKWYCDYYIDHTTVHTRLYPGVREFLELLKVKKISACVLTNKPERQTRKILDELGAIDLFDIIVGPESIGKLKPDPEGINYCLEKLGLDKEEAVMVGDSYSDILTGQAAGTHTCGVLYGIGDVKKLLAQKPEVCVEKELAEMFSDGKKYIENIKKDGNKEKKMITDIEIAQNSKMMNIAEIAKSIGIPEDALEFYGKYKAKISKEFIDSVKDKKDGKLVLVTAINPTPMGEGKTTVTVGLGDAMNRIGKKTVIALREPSLGPVMGVKGGATGGGYAQVVPMEDINLHFTGDLHAITAANNLISAIIDNHIFQGNALDIDVGRITWKRCLDMNDRELRNIVAGLGGRKHGVPREDGFIITVATEIMAVLCLSSDLMDFKKRVSEIVVAYNRSGEPVTCGDLHCEGAVTLLMKDAIKPNLIQTLEHTPAFMHGGPFANIAHGCNSVIATKLALKMADYCITEAGFGADLGAEKFLDIKCRKAGLKPSAVVIVASVRALKHHGNGILKDGLENLGGHIENIHKYGVPAIVAINVFADDTEEELNTVADYCASKGSQAVKTRVHGQGGKGGEDLARALVKMIDEKKSNFKPLYPDDISIKEKIETVAKEIYGAKGVVYSAKANEDIAEIEKMGKSDIPVCIAKTQYSFSDNAKLLGRPKDFNISVSEVKLSAGAGFAVVMTGSIITMPGLSKEPAALKLDIDEEGVITGLF